jgi:hypothetical protein
MLPDSAPSIVACSVEIEQISATGREHPISLRRARRQLPATAQPRQHGQARFWAASALAVSAAVGAGRAEACSCLGHGASGAWLGIAHTGYRLWRRLSPEQKQALRARALALSERARGMRRNATNRLHTTSGRIGDSMAEPEQRTAVSDRQGDSAEEPSAAEQAQDEQARQEESGQESPA